MRIPLVFVFISFFTVSVRADEKEWTLPSVQVEALAKQAHQTGKGASREEGSFEGYEPNPKKCKSVEMHVQNTGTKLTRTAYAPVKGLLGRPQWMLVDVEKVHLSDGPKILEQLGDDSSALTLKVEVVDHSIVTRPLGDSPEMNCERASHLVDWKLVLPANAARISKMGVGELWEISTVLIYSAAGPEGVEISFGARTTLKRLSDDKARFRARIKKVAIRPKARDNGQIVSARAFFAEPSRFLDQGAVSRVMRHLPAFGNQSADGQIMLEIIADPRDPAQAEALAKALLGDFGAFIKSGSDAASHSLLRGTGEMESEWQRPGETRGGFAPGSPLTD